MGLKTTTIKLCNSNLCIYFNYFLFTAYFVFYLTLKHISKIYLSNLKDFYYAVIHYCKSSIRSNNIFVISHIQKLKHMLI